MATRPGPGFTYDRLRGRYRAPNGQFVSPLRVRQALDQALDAAADRAKALGLLLRKGEITRSDWYLQMRTIVKDTQLYSMAVARGGWAQMTGTAFGQTSGFVGGQFDFLNRLLRQLEGGLPLDGQFLQRSAMYPQAARSTFHDAFQEEQITQGKTEERNILHQADHCKECPDLSAKGWVPIGTLTPIGKRRCLNNCRCTIEYR